MSNEIPSNPEIVYKYRSWNNPFHKDCLLKNELYFASPAEINDPFDFRIFIDFSLLDTDEKRMLYIKHGLAQLRRHGETGDLGDIEEWKLQQLKGFKEYPEDVQKHLDYKEEVALIKFRILCLSQVWNSILMWSHYADNHRGFCLGYSMQNFSDAGLGLSGPVKYLEDYPTIDPLSLGNPLSMFLRTLVKAKGWEYEEEFRVIQILDKEKRKLNAPIIYKNAELKEILLGVHMSQEYAAEVARIGKERNIAVFAIQKVPKKFQITRVRVGDWG